MAIPKDEAVPMKTFIRPESKKEEMVPKFPRSSSQLL